MNSSPTTIIFLLQLGALWVLFAFLVKDYARDRMRENLFAIRDRLFDEVANSDRAFRNPDYLHLRSYVNQVIRRGHAVTPSRGVLYEILIRIPGVTDGISPSEMREQVTEQMKWLSEAEKSNPRTKEVHGAVHMELLKYYSLTSPIFVLLMVGAVLFVACSMGASGLSTLVQRAFDRFFGQDVDRGITTNGDLVAATTP